VVFACIAPHGKEIIPELAGDMFNAFAETRRGMEKLARLMMKQKPETIVLATPHGLRLEATIGVVISEFTEGTLEANGKQVKLRCECDRELAKHFLERARSLKLPAVGANYGTSEGPTSCMPMDWGTFIPLWFLTRRPQNKFTVVVVTPSREIPLQDLVRLGESIAEASQTSGKRVAFVASADQGHTHKPNGPYGFHSASAQFDALIRRGVVESDLKPLFHLQQQFIENAKPDSLWQIAILQGVLNRVPMKSHLLSYQAPIYYGMLCATYMPT